MSSLLVLQHYNNVYMGSDTAVSCIINNKIYRLNEKGKKLYVIDKQLIFCSGDMDIAYKIMSVYGKSNIKTVENLQSIARLYCSSDATIEIVVTEINTKKNKIDVYQIPSYKDFKIIEKEINKGDLALFSGGIKVEESFNIAYKYIKQDENIYNIYQKTFNEISYEGIGGDLVLYKISLNGVEKIYENKIKEKNNIKHIDKIHDKHLIVGQNIYGKVIGSEKLTITNSSGKFEVNQNHMTATDMQLSLTTTAGNGKIYIDPNVGIKIQNNSGGSWRDALYMDTSGNLTMDGRLKITNNGIQLFDAYKDIYGGRLKIYDSKGGLNVTIGVEDGLGDNIGGTLKLHNDSGERRVELGITKNKNNGVLNLRASTGNAIIQLDQFNNGGFIGVRSINDTGMDYPSTYLTTTTGYVGGQEIATKSWVMNAINNAISSSSTSTGK